ncbi:hypothetical protein [Peribacillus sp. SCS-37]|uniref:hypothetical protein n=1 Tax=Paraperibacillus esterisolvens TaxID=3115296 RepID=UPI00390628F9
MEGPYFYYYNQPPQTYINPRIPAGADPYDVKLMQKNAKKFLLLQQEIGSLLTKISSDQSFARKLKSAAAAGQDQKVNALIQSTGVHTPVKIDINPDRIAILFLPPADGEACFGITIALCW